MPSHQRLPNLGVGSHRPESVRCGKGPWVPVTSVPLLAHSEEHGYARVREGILQQWKDIYEDQTLKDVEIIFSDGEKVWADSLILRRSSAVFNAMLTHNMRERQTMSMNLGDDCPSCAFRFFLRLLYTGTVDPSDWPSEEPEQSEPERQPAQASQQPPAAPVEGAPPELMTAAQFTDALASFSAAPRPQSIPGTLFVEAQGVFGVPVVRNGTGPYVPAVNQDLPKSSRSPTSQSSPMPPLDLLLTAACLAKKYQVDWLLSVLVDVLKKRVSDESFETIIGAAMRMDLSPVRLCALEFAKTSSVLLNRYEAGDFPPEIVFEMQAVFPVRVHAASDLSI